MVSQNSWTDSKSVNQVILRRIDTMNMDATHNIHKIHWGGNIQWKGYYQHNGKPNKNSTGSKWNQGSWQNGGQWNLLRNYWRLHGACGKDKTACYMSSTGQGTNLRGRCKHTDLELICCQNKGNLLGRSATAMTTSCTTISRKLNPKQQWFNSIVAARIRYQKEQAATQGKWCLMESWATYQSRPQIPMKLQP